MGRKIIVTLVASIKVAQHKKEHRPIGLCSFLVAAFGGWDLSLTAFGTEGSTSFAYGERKSGE